MGGELGDTERERGRGRKQEGTENPKLMGTKSTPLQVAEVVPVQPPVRYWFAGQVSQAVCEEVSELSFK